MMMEEDSDTNFVLQISKDLDFQLKYNEDRE